MAALVALCLTVSAGVALAVTDFGVDRDQRLRSSFDLFGVGKPLTASSTTSVTQAQAVNDPTSLVTLASALHARVVTAGVAAPNIDQIAFWPDDTAPTHLIFCNEEGTGAPGVQRVRLSDGLVETIVTGTTSCDPVRRTVWGTILFGEEAGAGPNGGRMYELINPLETTGVTLNRTAGTFSGGIGAQNLTARPALGRLSFEGLAIYSTGVVYFGDELRPGVGNPGGSFYKFIPATLRVPGTPPITSLDASPLIAGTIYGLRVGTTDNGQGTQWGFGSWVRLTDVPNTDLRPLALTNKLSGYYRPEDFDLDGAAKARGKVRFCGANTGNEGNQNYGEIACISDGTFAESAANTARPEIQLLVQGNPEFAMPDNVAYQPGRGNWLIHEDADTGYLRPHNNDLWACLPDGQDDDLMSDGCVRVGTLNDLDAEWTGGIFDASGKHFYVSVQHNASGKGTILDITGWE
jgi:secreted PhoX family phosphatase